MCFAWCLDVTLYAVLKGVSVSVFRADLCVCVCVCVCVLFQSDFTVVFRRVTCDVDVQT